VASVKILLASVAMAVACLFLAAPAHAQEQAGPENVKPPEAANGTETSPAAPGNIGAGVDIHKYVIGAEDVLYIRVWREPDFTGPEVVRPDGKITMPLIGELQAGGLTPEQLSKSVAAALSKYINKPDVMISLQSVQSKRYFIDGQVNRAGEYKLVTPTTVLEALSHAGGFRDWANVKKIRILRGATTFRFNYKDVSRGKKMEENIYLENGDHIIVP